MRFGAPPPRPSRAKAAARGMIALADPYIVSQECVCLYSWMSAHMPERME